jgi:hypothetical protein
LRCCRSWSSKYRSSCCWFDCSLHAVASSDSNTESTRGGNRRCISSSRKSCPTDGLDKGSNVPCVAIRGAGVAVAERITRRISLETRVRARVRICSAVHQVPTPTKPNACSGPPFFGARHRLWRGGGGRLAMLCAMSRVLGVTPSGQGSIFRFKASAAVLTILATSVTG